MLVICALINIRKCEINILNFNLFALTDIRKCEIHILNFNLLTIHTPLLYLDFKDTVQFWIFSTAGAQSYRAHLSRHTHLSASVSTERLTQQVSFNQHTQKCTWCKGGATDVVAPVQNAQLLRALRPNKHGASA